MFYEYKLSDDLEIHYWTRSEKESFEQGSIASFRETHYIYKWVLILRLNTLCHKDITKSLPEWLWQILDEKLQKHFEENPHE